MSRPLHIYSLHASTLAVIPGFCVINTIYLSEFLDTFSATCYLIKFDNILLDTTEYCLIQDQAYSYEILSFELYKEKGEKEKRCWT